MANINQKLQDIDIQRMDLEKQRDIMHRLLKLQEEKKLFERQLEECREQEYELRKKAEEALNNVEKERIFSQIEKVRGKAQALEEKLCQIVKEIDAYDIPDDSNKNFNKYVCFSNIRELLKASEAKIGQIEKSAGCQAGYMSRLDKPGNTSEPSVEFIVTAAKMLGASLDALVMTDLAEMTPTEKYLVGFFQKLQSDTIADKLDWMTETADSLNRMESDINGYVEHPLFSYETFYEEGETEYPNEVNRIVFVSDSFGPRTAINGDCYNLRLKGGSYLYLMDICKSVYRIGDADAFAMEIWMYNTGSGCQLLASSKKVSPLSPLVGPLVATVRERVKHPKIKKDLKMAIDAFMADDLEDDDLGDIPEGLPFN